VGREEGDDCGDAAEAEGVLVVGSARSQVDGEVECLVLCVGRRYALNTVLPNIEFDLCVATSVGYKTAAYMPR
jgi:hypothetical protein